MQSLGKYKRATSLRQVLGLEEARGSPYNTYTKETKPEKGLMQLSKQDQGDEELERRRSLGFELIRISSYSLLPH